MPVSPDVDVDQIALQLTISPGDRVVLGVAGQQALAMATVIGPHEAITAYHVVNQLDPESELTVRLRDTEPYAVTVVATDPAADLALLRAPSPFASPSMRLAERVPEINKPWLSFLVIPSAPGAPLAGIVRKRLVLDGVDHLLLAASPGIKNPGGASGAPVVVDGAIAGILVRSNDDGAEWYAVPVTHDIVKRLRDREQRDSSVDEAFDRPGFFARLSPSSMNALSHADGLRLRKYQDKLHMEHLVMGLYLKEGGPARELFTAAGIGSEGALREILNAATDLNLADASTPSKLTALPPVSGHVQEALEHAQRIAQKNGALLIRSRHLLYGALSVEDCGVIRGLVSRGVSRHRIPIPDESPDAGTPIVGADSDAPSGVDRLGLELEIDALSALVASRSTKTPMSIGLFGNWGSGKSFFMQKMDERIRVFRGSAAGDPDSPYCGSIIQLWFNAWHYIDSSLWASLGAEIFEGLAHGLAEVRTDRDASKLADERTTLLVKRADAEAQRVKAQNLAVASTASLQTQEREVARIQSRTDREIEKSLGTKAVVEEALAVTSAQTEVKEALDTATRKLGWDDLSEQSAVAAQQLKEILELGSYSRSLLATVRDRSSARWWLAVATVAAVVVLLAPWLAPAVTVLEGTVQRVMSALLAFTVAATPVLRMAQRIKRLVSSASTAMKERITAKRESDLRAAEALRVAAELKAAADLAALERSREQVEKIDKQLEAIKPVRHIVDFIRERNQSTDYTSHFGVIAKARQDFEELTRLMQLVRDDPTNQAFPPVDRIVLYIDDLDRCPEDKVFEVLQAVHLLLAFPLFVVVVGVDPRWLFHSLKTRLSALGGQSNDDGDGAGEQGRGWRSTPLNYLEKIFQIPFTLRPMEDIGYEQLIDDLAASPESKASAHSPQVPEVAPRLPPVQPPVAPGAKAGEAAERAEKTPAKVPATPAAPVPGEKKQAVEEHAKRAHARLALSSWETEHMKRLYPLIPTPRATKRFVNVYRLLRGLTAGVQRTALIGTESDGGYRSALVLLAMVTGYPVEATEVMRQLLNRVNEQDCPENWWTLLEAIRTSRSPGQPAASLKDSHPRDDDQWDEMFDKLREVRALVGEELASKTMGEWAPMVARYSFASGRLLVADSKPGGESGQVH